METIRPEQLKAIDSPANTEVPSYNSVTKKFEWVLAAASSDHAALTHLAYADAGHTGFEPTVSKGNLTASAPLVFDQTRQVIGGATAISMPKATAVASGYLSSEDWVLFNNKQNTGTETLAGLTDVNVVGVANGQLLSYDTPTSKWVPVTVSGVGGTISGSGAVNEVTFWTDTAVVSGVATFTFDPVTGKLTTKPAGAAGIALDPNAASGNYTLSISPCNDDCKQTIYSF